MHKYGDTLIKVQSEKPPKCLLEYITNVIVNTELWPDDEYEDVIGGSFYLCEKPEDLEEIKTLVVGADGKWSNVTNSICIFDDVSMLGDNEYLAFLMCSNNAGGNTYFVPKGLFIPSVIANFELTKLNKR